MATQPIHANMACRKCGIEKPHGGEHFVLKLGKITSLCRVCNAADCKRRYEANRESQMAKNRERWHANKERYHLAQRRYYRDNIDERKAADKRYREANPEKRREAHRRWREANPERAAYHDQKYRASEAGKLNQKNRRDRWRKANPEKEREIRRNTYWKDVEASRKKYREWRCRNKERCNALQREWTKNNKAKVKAWDHARRKANGSGIFFTDRDIGMLLCEQDFLCTYCLADLEGGYEADHFIPVAKGGGHEPENIVLACRPCNRSKGAKLPWDWRPDLFSSPT